MAEETIPSARAIVTRAEAKAAGLKRYFTGIPCRYGHITERHIVSKNCCECYDIYAAELRKRPDQIERAKAASKRSYNKNREAVLAKGRERAKTGYSKAYYEANKEAVLKLIKIWIKANPERRLVYRQKRRSAGSMKSSDVQRIEKAQNFKCAACRVDVRKSGRHIDHIIPITKGGTSDPSNIQILCPTCNRRKGARDPIDFMRSLGRLL